MTLNAGMDQQRNKCLLSEHSLAGGPSIGEGSEQL